METKNGVKTRNKLAEAIKTEVERIASMNQKMTRDYLATHLAKLSIELREGDKKLAKCADIYVSKWDDPMFFKKHIALYHSYKDYTQSKGAFFYIKFNE